LQQKEWLHISPLHNWPYLTYPRSNDWIANILCKWKRIGFSMQTLASESYLVKGEATPIHSLIPS
ncbi:10651_t:CDS:1, partial [Funneliformis geosporum]